MLHEVMGSAAKDLWWGEYGVFLLMMGGSAAIGLYFGLRKGQDTVDQYLLGGKRMGLLPIAASLICSLISGVTLLGTPTEVYTFGLEYALSAVSFLVLPAVLAWVFLPLFHPLQLVSLFQYMEMRFNSTVRRVVSLVYTLNLLLYIPLVIYGPGLAINQVSGLNVIGTTMAVSLLCIFYTTIGGLRAVCWTDLLQGVFMAATVVVLCIAGTSRLGGLAAVLKAARRGDRLRLVNLDGDPRARSGLLAMAVGVPFIHVCSVLANPSYLQRLTALRTLRAARWASLLFGLGGMFFVLSGCYMGLVLYAAYEGCDPLLNKEISRADQILPHYVIGISEELPGVSGVFLAGILSAALSTMSAAINTVGGTLYADFVEPLVGVQSERAAGITIRTISASFGIASTSLVLFLDRLAYILELAYSVVGLTSGVVVGILFLGMFAPWANSKGAAAGGLFTTAIMGWTMLGWRAAVRAGQIRTLNKPLSVDLCLPPFNISLQAAPENHGESREPVFPLFEVSPYLFAFMSCSLCLVTGAVVSYFTRSSEVPKKELLSPLVHRLLPRDYSPVSTRMDRLEHSPQTCS